MTYTALVILNFNNADDTRRCIESVLEFNSAPVKFIVVDNDSRPEQREALQSAMADIFGEQFIYIPSPDVAAPSPLPRAVLVETGENLGYARGNNVGLQLAYADPDIDRVMVLNNDILFVQDIIPGLIAVQDSLPDCAIVSPVLYKRNMDGIDMNCARREETVNNIISVNFLTYWWALRKKNKVDIFRDRYLLNFVQSGEKHIMIDLPSGSCMLVHKDVFQRLGSFDPGTFLYYEENILHKKVQREGLSNYLSLEHKCIHLGAATIGQFSRNNTLAVRAARSRKYYVKNYSGVGRMKYAWYICSEWFFAVTRWLSDNLLHRKG